jgi:hypothetical protein
MSAETVKKAIKEKERKFGEGKKTDSFTFVRYNGIH